MGLRIASELAEFFCFLLLGAALQVGTYSRPSISTSGGWDLRSKSQPPRGNNNKRTVGFT
jgi:hypothetical protein